MSCATATVKFQKHTKHFAMLIWHSKEKDSICVTKQAQNSVRIGFFLNFTLVPCRPYFLSCLANPVASKIKHLQIKISIVHT